MSGRDSETEQAGSDPRRPDFGDAATIVADAAHPSPLYHRVRSALFGPPTHETIGRYAVHEVLGAGGMGVVYLGHDPELDRPVAIKLLHAELSSDETGRRRVRREAMALARLAHPNVVMVFETGTHENQSYVVMEYVEGQTLREWTSAAVRDWRETLEIHLQALQGLAAAHRCELVHRDYKPDNVLVDADGRARVVDFGLARAATDAHAQPTVLANVPLDEFTRTGTVAGTPAYMAPEQIRGERVDGLSDQFSFCVTLYEGLYGRRPFTADTLEGLRTAIEAGPSPLPDSAGVPAAIGRILLRGLASAPTDRWPDIETLGQQLRRSADERPSRRNRWVVVLAAIVGATGIGWAWSHTVETPDEPAEGVVTAQPPDSTGFAPLPTPLPEDPAAATIHRLDNGLTYLVAEDHASPLVSAQVCVRRHIPPDNPLLSPWFTYAMTRGTERAGTTDFAAEKPFIAAQWAGVDKLATQTDPRARARTLAEIDAAFVSAARFEVVDETKDLLAEITNGGWRMSASPHAWCHQTSLPAGRLSVWLVWMSDLVQNLALRSPLQILRDTIQIHLDLDPEEFITRQLGGSAPADAAAIEALLSTSEHAFRQYTRQVTVPGNVMFSFAGNIDPASVRALLDAELGGWASGPTLAPPGLGASRTGLEELTAGKLNQAGLGWRTPALGEPGFAAARLLLGLLLALAEDDVRDGQSFDVSGSFDDRGMLLLWTKSDRGSPEAQEQLLRALLDRIARGAFEDSIWLGVRRRAASEPMTDGNGPVTNPVQTLAERAFVFGVPWASMVALPADYASTPREDVESLARALAASEPARVHVRPDPSPAVTDALGDAPTVEPSEGHSPLYEELINRPYTPPEPKFLVEGRDFVVDRLEDRTVIASQIPGSSYALTLRVEQGELTIPGICDAVDRLAGPDTGETSDTWAATGARVDWRCGDRSVILTLRGPNESFVATLDLWSRWLAAPSFRTQGSSLPSTSMAATDALQRYLLFGRPTVLAADEADAAALWRSMWAAPSWVLYAGPDADSLSALQLPPITGNRPEHTTVPLDLAQNVVLVEMANVTRPVIGLGIVGPRVHTKDRELWRLYQYMDHITRPDYTVVIVNFDEAEGRHLELGGGEFRPFTSAVFETPYENAIDGLRWGLQVASWERTVSEASLAGAKTQVENELRHDFISRSDVPGRVYGFVSRGSSSDPRLETWQRLPSIALDEVRRFADAMEDTEPAIGIIASPGLVDERALREFGPVQHLGLEQLFVTRGASGEP